MNGSFSSPKFPSNYPRYSNCEWRITVPHGYCVRLSFSSFQTQRCCDWVEVSSNSTGLMRRLAGYVAPNMILFGGQRLKVRFRSDGSVSRRGFRAVFKASSFCPSPSPHTSRPPWGTPSRPQGMTPTHLFTSRDVGHTFKMEYVFQVQNTC